LFNGSDRKPGKVADSATAEWHEVHDIAAKFLTDFCCDGACRRSAEYVANTTRMIRRKVGKGTRMTMMDDASLLLVDEDPSAILVMSRILGAYADQRFATSSETALRLARESPPDLILLDSKMPDLGGFELCQILKADRQLADIPVIFVTSQTGASFELAGFVLGVADFITKPVMAPLVQARVKAQLEAKRVTDALRSVSATDVLTGVANRLHFDEVLQFEWQRAWRGAGPLALLIFDIDNFKAYNAASGAQAGDDCLRAFSRVPRACRLPTAGLFARYDGDAFALLLPQTAPAAALAVAQRILAAVAALAMPHPASTTASEVTVSIGIGCYDDVLLGWSDQVDLDGVIDGTPERSAHELVGAAVEALHQSKASGGGQVQLIDVAALDRLQHRDDSAQGSKPRIPAWN
jgi:diguanylate cyclase (GGDEF)-like protein